jgi:aminopeptidase N
MPSVAARHRCGDSRILCAALAVTLSSGCAIGPKPPTSPALLLRGSFGEGRAAFHPTEVAPYTFAQTTVRIHFDVGRGIVYGRETVVVRPKRNALRTLPFNSLGLHFRRIAINDRPAAYRLDGSRQMLDVSLAHLASSGEPLRVDFVYWTQPQRGVYFVRPDSAYPKITPQIWSQGEPTDNRRWFPTWDEPNQKTPSELVITVPRGWTAVANGYLKSHRRSASNETWDWNSPLPKSTYLIAFVAGPLSKHHTTLGQARDGGVGRYGNGGMDVDSYVPPPYADLNAPCFGQTNDIVAFFQRIIGVRFPFEKYDQTAAERFTFGGMENASATTQTARALHPPIEDEEASCDSLISHELAQQWWGDDATMSDWSNMWLHEGFATYFEELWSRERYGEAEFEYERYQAQQAYFDETQRYYRPIVDYDYFDPLDIVDASSHERPGEILHMLRWTVGDARFFRALRAYLLEYQYKNADTAQFFAAIGKSLGTNLDWFKNEWFYRAAYPHYYVTDRYDPAGHAVTYDIRQKNYDGKPFRVRVAIDAFVNGRAYRVQPTIDRNQQTVRLTGVFSKPQMVLFDPNNNVLRQLTFPKSVDELTYQIANARHVGDREWALGELASLTASTGTKRSTAMRTIRTVSLFDPFYGLRADAVAVSASFDDGKTVNGALRDSDKRVRIAAAGAAGRLEHPPDTVIRALVRMSDDADPLVAGAALQSLGTLRPPGAYDRLVAALHRPSFGNAVASGALRGLAACGDRRALPLVLVRTTYGTAEQERDTAIVALAQLSKHLHESSAVLPSLLKIVEHDPLIGSRIAATTALGILGDPRALPVLASVEQNDSQLLVQIYAWRASQTIRN